MAKLTFSEAHRRALQYQQTGDVAGVTALIQEAYRAGFSRTQLQILSSLAEGALQFPNFRGPS
jgi:hypothetical protein